MPIVVLDGSISSSPLRSKIGARWCRSYVVIDDAIRDENWEAVDLLLRYGTPISLDYYVVDMIERHGSMSMTRSLLDRDHNHYAKHIACAAASNNHRDTLRWMLEEINHDYNDLAASAAENNHREIVMWMIELGAWGYDYIEFHARNNGHHGLANTIEQIGAMISHNCNNNARV